MKYVGLQEQITSNNRKSIFLLIGFPGVLLGAVYAVLMFASYSETGGGINTNMANDMFIEAMPFVFIGTGIWFLIAYWGHSAMIDYASGSKTLERKENMRVYNLTENLCMGVGMKMPKLKIIETDALNAFASGLNEKNYSVTLTRGIINKLDDDELEGVIAHELMHIRNKDVKLLVISIIFVGIFSLIIQIAFRSLLYGSMTRSRRKDGKGGGGLIIVILVVSLVAYLISLLFKFALSRKREFMADAGAAEMTRNPLALANALRKISGNSKVDSVKSDDVKEMFIDNGPDDNSANFLGGIGGLFATHPPIKDRISVLEQF
ncbi:M48 family metallopeptidase [Crocinitomicaceae bacterium]|jgi:heat shock protein HtpX|nr:M48 family metallopeptidase [Crocinitomicaceae bacterium]MDC0297430.1 M48 family metallopeptidase [Crocinitomicaceae bacterium]